MHQGSSTHYLCLHTHTHHSNKQKFNTSRLSVLSSQFRIPEYVSASPNYASTRRDTKEEQTGKRDGCEEPSLAVTLPSLSLTHRREHEAAALTSAHKSSLREHDWKAVSENILFFPLMFTVLPSCFCQLPSAPGVFSLSQAYL